MSGPDPKPSESKPSSVNQIASAWLERFHSGAWTGQDQAGLDAWLAESSAHRAAYWRLEEAWSNASRLNALQQPMRQQPAPQRRILPILARTAAGLALVGVLGIVTAKYVGSPDTRTYATDLGGRETLALSDGSRIELNTNTVLRVAAKGRNRTVWLDKGEAYFEIKHDAAHPFVVFAAGHRITDLGTKFLVRQNSNRIEVALIEGKARLDSSDAAKAQSAVLTPGEVAVATVDRISVKRKPASALRDELGWQRGILVFRASTLAEVAAEYNRYNARKIVIADDATAARTMSATLPANDLDTFARIARNFLGLHVRETKDEIVISQ